MRVSRYPSGYLELMGVKSQGTTPPDVADAVMPVVDMTEFYAKGASLSAFASTAVAVTTTGNYGAASGFQVPTGELWRVHSVSITANANLAVGTVYRCRPCVWDSSRGAYLVGPDACSGIATERPAITWHWNTPIIWTPGWQFGLWCESVTLGTGQSWAIYLDYDRLT